jgi:hypothetical protein
MLLVRTQRRSCWENTAIILNTLTSSEVGPKQQMGSEQMLWSRNAGSNVLWVAAVLCVIAAHICAAQRVTYTLSVCPCCSRPCSLQGQQAQALKPASEECCGFPEAAPPLRRALPKHVQPVMLP